LVAFVRCRTVENVDSIGLVVRKCTQCSARLWACVNRPEVPVGSLDQLLVAYPWLRLLGDDVLSSLDIEELVDPHPVALRLGPTVVAYRRGARPRPDRVSLCSMVPAARVSSARAADLADAERANPGIVLVEYAPEICADGPAAEPPGRITGEPR
jgi:hypothetical protein